MSLSFIEYIEQTKRDGFADHIRESGWSHEDILADYFRRAKSAETDPAERDRVQAAFDMICPNHALERQAREADPNSVWNRLARRAAAESEPAP